MITIAPVPVGDQLREAFGCFPSGVTAVCAEVDGIAVGLAASSFTSVSIEPPLVSVCMQHSSTTWPTLRQRPRLGVSVLAEGQDTACARLAGKADDRFVDTPTTVADNGALFIDGATLWLDCTIHTVVPTGDHDIVVLYVNGVSADPASPPLVFHGSRFRRLATA